MDIYEADQAELGKRLEELRKKEVLKMISYFLAYKNVIYLNR